MERDGRQKEWSELIMERDGRTQGGCGEKSSHCQGTRPKLDLLLSPTTTTTLRLPMVQPDRQVHK